ncbi:MAG TPA: sugar ABC transporter substrate-binding protein [Bacillota bacterium]|nr:sugar ABC transporter substrate-binding protein [Bacillota bacterium]
MSMKGKAAKKILFAMMVLTLIIVSGIYAPVSFGVQKVPTLRVLTANHPWTDAIKPLIPDFEKATGIKINLESYEENQLTPKLTVEFTSGASSVDVFMTRPLQEGRLFSRNNWYQPLDKYINKKDTSWNFSDYPGSSIQAATYNNKLYALPLVTEWQVVFYRKDLFEQAKMNPPSTLEELEAAAKAFHNPSADMYGIVSRGQRAAAVTQFSSYLYAFGGDFIKKGKCVLDSPEAIKAFKFYGKLLHDYGPPGVTNMSWPQAQALFASGKVAMWTDASTLISGLLIPDKSKVADKVGVAVFPAGPAGSHPFMVLPWAISMSGQSRNKTLAWTFIKWATSPEITKKAQLAGNTMSRASVWGDPDVLAKIQPDLALSAKKTGPIATPYDRPLMTSVVEARDIIGDVIVKAIETGGTGDIESMAKTATKKVNDLLEKAGELGK